jgi:hypothetical protein
MPYYKTHQVRKGTPLTDHSNYKIMRSEIQSEDYQRGMKYKTELPLLWYEYPFPSIQTVKYVGIN